MCSSDLGNRFFIQDFNDDGRVFVDIETHLGRIKRWTTATGVTPLSTSPAWYNLIVTYDGTNASDAIKVYVDGVLATIASKGTDQDISAIVNRDMFASFGNLKDVTGNQPAKHFIFAVGTWDIELPAADIMQLKDTPQLDIRSNSGTYVSSANNKGFWLLGKELSPNLGKNQVAGGQDVSVETSIDDTDRSTDIPT